LNDVLSEIAAHGLQSSVPMDIFETQVVGMFARCLFQLRRLCLRQVHQAPVVTEIGRQEFRMPIKPEPFFHETIEMTRQEVRQVKRARFIIRQSGKFSRARVELVTVRAGQAFYAKFGQDFVQRSPRAAISVRDEQLVEFRPVLLDGRSYSAWDFLWPVMQVRWQALYLQVRPAIQLFELNDFLR